MKVKIVRDTMWFRAGEQYDIDTDLAKQMVALGDAEALNEIKENKPATEKKVERQADKRAKK